MGDSHHPRFLDIIRVALGFFAPQRIGFYGKFSLFKVID